MIRTKPKSRSFGFNKIAGALVLQLGLLVAAPAVLATESMPKPDDVLKSMSDYLGKTQAFSMNADIDFEVMLKNGQKIQLSSTAKTLVQRPGKFRFQSKGMVADSEIIYDGSKLTVFGKTLNLYAQIEAKGNIDDGIKAYELETGIPAPGADLIFSDTHATLIAGVEESTYIGTAFINGVESHHLAFREMDVDWQLWIQTGDQPLPMKYVITSKLQTGAPQFQIRLRDWNTSPKVEAAEFEFTPPEGAVVLDSIELDELGEIVAITGGK